MLVTLQIHLDLLFLPPVSIITTATVATGRPVKGEKRHEANTHTSYVSDGKTVPSAHMTQGAMATPSAH